MTESTDQGTPVASVAATDIRIDRIVVRFCRFDDHLFDQAVLQLGRSPEKGPSLEKVRLSPKIRVWMNTEPQFAIVSLLIKVAPHTEPSWTAAVEVVGHYSCGENPVIPLEKFAWYNGIAYLVPYVRERLASMTMASEFGTYILPPLSVAKLVELSKLTSEPSAPADLEPSTPAQT